MMPTPGLCCLGFAARRCDIRRIVPVLHGLGIRCHSLTQGTCILVRLTPGYRVLPRRSRPFDDVRDGRQTQKCQRSGLRCRDGRARRERGDPHKLIIYSFKTTPHVRHDLIPAGRCQNGKQGLRDAAPERTKMGSEMDAVGRRGGNTLLNIQQMQMLLS
jgi:hypothetical protein